MKVTVCIIMLLIFFKSFVKSTIMEGLLKSLPPKDKAEAVWRRFLSDEAAFVPVALDGSRVRVLGNLSLEFSNAWKKDSGDYLCFKGTEIMAKYYLDIVRLEPHRYIVMNGRMKKNKGPSKDVALKSLNLIIGMAWSEWSECSRCDDIGKRRRVGICTIRVQCPPKAGIVDVTDKTGKVIDTVDNSQGIYSMHQPLPQLPPLVKRRVVYEAVGKSIIMACPGNTAGKFLTWRNESYIINPSKVHILTKGRVKIDLSNSLYIRKLRYSDTATYSCWDDKKLVGTTRLQVVDKELGQSYRMYILNIALLFTFTIILLVSVTVCKNVRLQSKE